MGIAWDTVMVRVLLLAIPVPIGKPCLARYDIPVNSTILGPWLRSKRLCTGPGYFRQASANGSLLAPVAWHG